MPSSWCKVIDAVNSPWLRALPDFGNSMMKGDEDFNYRAVDAMFRHAYNISHVKDSEVDNGKVFPRQHGENLRDREGRRISRLFFDGV